MQGRHETERLRGYYIDWVVDFEKYEVQRDDVQVTATIPENNAYNKVWINLVPSMLEIVERFTPGQWLKLRGILMEVFITTFKVNYADFKVVESA